MIEIINDRIVHINDIGNMIELDDGSLNDLTELCKNMRKLIGDLILDKNSIEPTEDIYDYIIEKIYLMPAYTDEISFKSFNRTPKEKLLIAFNKFFFDMIEKNENTRQYTD
jgi:hypothetical protein